MTREEMIDKTAGLMTMNVDMDILMHSYYMKMYNYLEDEYSEKDTELLEDILEEVQQTYNNNLGKKEDEQIN